MNKKDYIQEDKEKEWRGYFTKWYTKLNTGELVHTENTVEEVQKYELNWKQNINGIYKSRLQKLT
jgi:hypothetical protein